MSIAFDNALATAKDLRELGDDARAEVIGGAIVAMAPPTFFHGDAQGTVFAFLKLPFNRGRGGPGGWWLSLETEIELSVHEVYRPDVAGWRKDRVADAPPGLPVTIRPDWVCEVLSPSTRRNDLGVKLRSYFRAEVGHYWLVDTAAKVLTVLRRGESDYETILEAGPSDVVRAEPFDAIEIVVADLFG